MNPTRPNSFSSLLTGTLSMTRLDPTISVEEEIVWALREGSCLGMGFFFKWAFIQVAPRHGQDRLIGQKILLSVSIRKGGSRNNNKHPLLYDMSSIVTFLGISYMEFINLNN
jgi:hypothetical protein